MNYLYEPRGSAAPYAMGATDLEPELLDQIKAVIFSRIKAENYEGAAEEYGELSKNDKLAISQYLRTRIPKEDMKTFESAIAGETVFSMAPMVIQSWAVRNAWVIGGVLLAGAAVWYAFGKRAKRKKRKS